MKTGASRLLEVQTACVNGEVEQVRACLQRLDASQQRQAIDSMTLTSAEKGHADLLEYCLQHGGNVTDRVAHLAVTSGSTEAYKVLLSAGLDVNTSFGYSGNALLVALRRNDQRMTSFLLSRGAEPNGHQLLSGCYGPLAVAAYWASLNIVRLLVTHGARIEQSLALQLAAKAGRTDVLQYLLDKGADVNEVPALGDLTYAVDYELGAAIHYAAQARQLDAVIFLLDHGADVKLRDHCGRTVVERAKEGQEDWQELQTVLRGRGLSF